MRICILGWGSLIWDTRPEFDQHHGTWNLDGPMLRLEFSRVSASRQGALTLAIDSVHGARCRVAYAESSRKNPEDTICDLRSREGTVLRHIGAMFLDGSKLQGGDEATREAIRTWAKEKQFDVVVWTDLPADFQKKAGMTFSLDAACNYLQGLSVEGKAKAAEYVWRAPEFIVTPLRQRLQGQPWFTPPQ